MEAYTNMQTDKRDNVWWSFSNYYYLWNLPIIAGVKFQNYLWAPVMAEHWHAPLGMRRWAQGSRHQLTLGTAGHWQALSQLGQWRVVAGTSHPTGHLYQAQYAVGRKNTGHYRTSASTTRYSVSLPGTSRLHQASLLGTRHWVPVAPPDTRLVLSGSLHLRRNMLPKFHGSVLRGLGWVLVSQSSILSTRTKRLHPFSLP